MAKQNSNILVIDDNEQVRESLELFLGRHFTNIFALSSPKLLNDIFSKQNIDLILLDMNFAAGRYSGNEGIFMLSEIRKLQPETIVILITAYGDINLAVRGIKEGAFDFVLKPWDNQKLLSTIKAGLKLKKSKKELKESKEKAAYLQAQMDEDIFFTGNSSLMVKIQKTIKKVARTDASVLITGENGTGKSLIAKEIHKNSQRRNEIMMHIDLGAIPESLFESELFGHKQGAFTDAKQNKTGKIELANNGTLFLDEVANIPLNIQAKLLSVLQQKKVTKLGGNIPRNIDFRLITATNKQLNTMCEKGGFREDLFFRINTIQIEIPPLRERKKDILPFAYHFLQFFEKKYNKKGFHFSKTAASKLESHSWPGNIRELKHTIEKAVILADTPCITAELFGFHESKDTSFSSETYNLEKMEKQAIQKVIKLCGGNMSKTAKELGISRTTLYAKIEKYGL